MTPEFLTGITGLMAAQIIGKGNTRRGPACNQSLHFSSSLVSTSNLPCWLVEEFVVAEECAPCSNFQAVSICFLSLFSHTESDWDGVTVSGVPLHCLLAFFLDVSV